MIPNPGFTVMVLFKGEYYSNQCILCCPTLDNSLLNLQYNVPLTRVPSAIVEPPVFVTRGCYYLHWRLVMLVTGGVVSER